MIIYPSYLSIPIGKSVSSFSLSMESTATVSNDRDQDIPEQTVLSDATKVKTFFQNLPVISPVPGFHKQNLFSIDQNSKDQCQLKEGQYMILFSAR